MKVAYFDCTFGAAGDMLVGALIGAGIDVDLWKAEIEKIALPEGSFQIVIEDVVRCGISSKKFSVRCLNLDGAYEKERSGSCPEGEHDCAIKHGYSHSHSHRHESATAEFTHTHAYSHTHTHTHQASGDSQPRTYSHSHQHTHKFEHQHAHEPGNSHEHSDLHSLDGEHDHSRSCVHQHGNEHGHSHEHSDEHTHEHGRSHEHSHDEHTQGHEHSHEHSHDEHHHGRAISEITKIIEESKITKGACELALKIFNNLAIAESRVHGMPPADVHFHEVGAIDAIVDVVAFAIGYDLLGIEKSIASPLTLGSGTVKTDHGIYPVPAPAVAYLIQAAGAPTSSLVLNYESLTPTGAAILTAICSDWGALPAFERIDSIGFGAGEFNPGTHPNVVRLM
ncbi:MAG: DUF111 family protein, partial [Cyanobacteria bacterium]|nr:DUF111 family protein [Cyanobacteriota bacterium]